LENLVQALVRESSIRSRQTPQIILTGLATLPKTTTLPNIVDHHQEYHHIPLPRSPSSKAEKIGNGVNSKTKFPQSNHQHRQQQQQQPVIKRQLDSEKMERERNARQVNGNKAPVLSNEAWMPNDYRMKTLGRDLSAANETLLIIKKREMSLAREMRRLLVSDLERAQTEERLDATHKVPCECCMQEFLYVNLPLKVSRKAIVDIRTKWSGTLNSATVFGLMPEAEQAAQDEEDSAKNNGKNRQQRALDKKNQLLSSVPACYDEVGVCVFCAQFFQVQEEYRPSYLSITQTERRAAMQEAKRREQEYWDPLKMVEKDRHEQEAREAYLQAQKEQMLATQLLSGEEGTPSGTPFNATA
jgi:hypothetical protein